MGLVNRVVPDAKVGDVVQETAEMIAANAPMTVESAKYIVAQTVMNESERNLDECAARVKACFESADYIEGRRAFLEKRKANFVGA